METATQLSITMPNIPGSFARVCDALRGAKVNIEAVCCTEGKAHSTIHLVVSDHEGAKAALTRIGRVKVEEILAFSMENKPGAIFSIVRTCAGANINIRNLYATTHQARREAMVYVVVDNLEKAKKLLMGKKSVF
jgi:hypothetical protein